MARPWLDSVCRSGLTVPLYRFRRDLLDATPDAAAEVSTSMPAGSRWRMDGGIPDETTGHQITDWGCTLTISGINNLYCFYVWTENPLGHWLLERVRE